MNPLDHRISAASLRRAFLLVSIVIVAVLGYGVLIWWLLSLGLGR